MIEISERVADVRSRKDLAAFVRLLARDFHDHGTEWENPDLSHFLEALAGWIDDMDGYYTNSGKRMPSEPGWETIAEMLAAARIYE